MTNRNVKAGFRGGRDNGAMQENMELLTGQRGNGLDRAITIRELAQLGLINVSRNSNGSVTPKPVPPTFPDDKPVDIPHAPVGFGGFGGFGAIMLEWKNPTFNGFAHAELWRAAPNVDNSAPNLDQAVLIATTPATVFGDIVNPGSTFYYWCRFVNVNNISGPYSDVDGVKVSTSPNIGDIIDDIGEQMKDSELVQGLITDISEGDKVAQEAINAAKDELAATDKTLQESIDAAKDELATADDLLAGVIAKVEVDYKNGDAEAHASIKELEQAVTTDDNVLAQQIAQMEAAFKASGESSTLTTNAKITTVEKTSTDATQALAERVTGLTAQWKKDDANILKSANAAITEATKVLTKEDEALAESLKSLEGKVNTGNTELAGSISDLSQVVITADQALALRVDKVEAAYKDADKETNSSVQSLTQTVTDAGQALAKRIDSIDADYKDADSELSGAISVVSEVVATDDNVLAQQIAQMEAAFKATNESATLTTNAKITSVQKTAADASGALAEKVDTVQSTINDVSTTVQQNSSAISTINKDGSTAYKAMWSTKAQAGDIKAGIGILAKSDGTSQVAISASQFFVFDPNKAGAIQPLFAIDKGKVVIPTALIESATIQILNAQIITADKVKAGISITSPKIEGAEFLGGWAKFGSGGPYSGYHTYISADGTVRTNRIYAYGGTFSNVVIAEDCIIKGKLTVGQIEGDIFKRYIVNKAYNGKFTATHSTSGSFRRVFSITIEPADITRTLIIPTIACYVWGVHRACYARCNGQSYSVDIRHEGTADHVYIDALVPIPASSIEQTVVVEIACWTSGSTSNAEWSISKQDLYVELFKSQIISA
ncbi:DUF1983 domain-containing protein [Photobacterium carnosum]|uniref:phage tail tip fiber protein n=1 Tax=Photobacterium carnosum TaxID=2023717 RepID=UPI001C90ACD7|nr:DUF1983 domain-containing protein [Photobacterium carnosum]MBY3789583.1 DUF1983 domain-containing protein [Photobacterium carnosum]